MQLEYHGKTYSVVGFAKSTVLPETFIVLQGQKEMLVAPIHDLSGLKHQGVSLDELRAGFARFEMNVNETSLV